MFSLLAQMKLEDVFRSTEENFRQSPDSNRVLALLLGLAGVVMLLLLFHTRHQRQATPKALNHHGKLVREVLRDLPIRSGELKQLKVLADQESCSSPLVLLLCPSIMARALKNRGARANRKIIGRLVRKLGG